MDEFLLKKQQVFHSAESIIFIWFILIASASVIIYCYGKYRRLKLDAAIQMKVFNKNIFLPDRRFFEKYGRKKELVKKDFMQMYSDAVFKEHLWRKEMGYFKELTSIVESLKLIAFYEFLALFVFVGVVMLEIFFMILPFVKG